MLRTAPWVCVLGLGLLTSGCASNPKPQASGEPEINDPIEPVNRGIFTVNQGIDTVVLRPIALGWRDIVPGFVRTHVHDVLIELSTPTVLANNLMQGNWDSADISFRRFLINAVAGVGGIFDVASEFDLAPQDGDFGQTLGVWGVDTGPYLYLPLLGPSDLRDAFGRVVDVGLDPFTYGILPHPDRAPFDYARLSATAIDARSRSISFTDDLQKSSLDYYASLRSLYLQRRAKMVSGDQAASAPSGAYPGSPSYPGQTSDPGSSK